MGLIRWSPRPGRRELARVNDDFDRWFEGFFDRSGTLDGWGEFTPAVDVEETPEAFVLRADLPGVDEKDIHVSMHNDTLTIRGERKRSEDHKEGGVHRIERVHGSFERSFTLGTAVRNDQVKADFRNGVLAIRLPKAEAAKERKIEIRTG